MKDYKYRCHVIVSVIISFTIGFISYLLFKPNQLNTSKGIIESIENPGLIHTQASYGYDYIFIITIISLCILLIIYKPLKKIIIKTNN